MSAAMNGYFAETGALPAALDALVDGRRLSKLPRDPAADAPYGFSRLGERRYELCADFSRESAPAAAGFWAHGAGHKCFEFDYSARRPPPVSR
ncbi:MAG TPA: hypothetical protein VFV10_12230 [Gammaproteobacteria bacterium]|nr:hypothetical protein [Gammaproteobacteria bacterium]